MNKIKNIILSILLIIIIGVGKVSALTVSENNLTIPAGTSKNVELTTNSEVALSSIEFTMVYSTYDVPANFFVNNKYTDSYPNGIKHKINLNEPTEGKISLGSITINVVRNPKERNGTITIHSAKGYTASGETVNLDSQTINVTIGEDIQVKTVTPKEFDKNALKEIKSSIVKIELQKDVFDYKVNVKENTEKLDLEAIPTDEAYKVEISNQVISELTDGMITITVSDNQDNKSVYNIKVNVLKEQEPAKIDDTTFKENNSYKGKWIVSIIVFGVMFFFGLIMIRKEK